MKIGLITVAGAALVFGGPAFAQQAPSCDGPQDACRQIVDISNQYNAAFNSHDVAAITGLFTTDAVDVGENVMLSGRAALEKFYTDGFKAGWATHSSGPNQVHVMGDSGWAVGSWSATPPGAKDASQKAAGTWGDVVVLQNGTWKIRMLTWNVTEAPPESAGANTAPNR